MIKILGPESGLDEGADDIFELSNSKNFCFKVYTIRTMPTDCFFFSGFKFLFSERVLRTREAGTYRETFLCVCAWGGEA